MSDTTPKPLVIGVSSTALFNLSEEDRIFRTQGLDAFSEYQIANKDKLLEPGAAFHLIEAFQRLNQGKARLVEFVVMSHNDPRVCLRVSNAIDHYGLDIRQWALLGGDSVQPFLPAYEIELFLSGSPADVREAIEGGLAAALVLAAPRDVDVASDEIRIAFDGDCVLFSNEAERVTRSAGLPAFIESERLNAQTPLGKGPFADFLSRLAYLQSQGCPIKTALVTARGVPAHKRAINTLQAWGVQPNQIHFRDGRTKTPILEAFKPHIYFDDNEKVCRELADRFAVFHVPNGLEDLMLPEHVSVNADPKESFLLICKMYLKAEYPQSERRLSTWFRSNFKKLSPESSVAFLDEFTTSAQQTPAGDQRRAGRPRNTSSAKLLSFLDKALWKYQANR